MSWKVFTPEELAILKANPYTKSLTEKNISFTLEFKQKFLEQLNQNLSPSTIAKNLGYDPELLGTSRIFGIAYHIREEAKSPMGLHEGRKVLAPSDISSEKFASLPQSRAMEKMQVELNYLKQEVEFIKKILKQGKS